jgi:hypothetical protein
MAFSPQSLSNQFPLKNPKESQETEVRTPADMANAAPDTRMTYQVSIQGGSVRQGGSGQRRACVTWRNLTRQQLPSLKENN